MERYLDDIGRHALLDREHEARLARRAREDDDRRARNDLVAANLRFVVSVAKRYRGCGVAFEDLVNEGNLGLLKAAERFDERHGVRFVTYAAWWIRRAILASLPPAVPDGAGEAGGRDRVEGRGHGSGPGRTGDGATGPASVVSLEDARRGRALLERIADDSAVDPERGAQLEALRERLDRGLAFLPEREERVLRAYFGLDGGRPRSLTAIGRGLGVSGERARQLKERALDRLRAGPHAGALAQFTR